jgi:hypothetical protein
MNKLDTNDIPGTLSVLQSDHSIVALCGADGKKGTALLQWEHWLTLSGLLVIPQSVYPSSPSREEMGMLSFMRIQKVMKADALVVITQEDGNAVASEDMQLIIVALHAGKRVYTSTYIGRHKGPDAEDAIFGEGNIACPLRSLDLTAPGYLFELTWEDLRSRDKFHKDTFRELKTMPQGQNDSLDPVRGGLSTNGGTHGAAVTARRSTPSEPSTTLLTDELTRAREVAPK